MDLNNAKIQETCTDAVFERGRDYRDEGRVQRIERFGDVVTAAVRGTNLYDVTVDLDEHTIDARCTCPYEGAGECKHVVAVLLDVIADPPQDESERVERVIEDVSSDDLHAFVRDNSPKTRTCVSSSSHGLATAASRSKRTVTRSRSCSTSTHSTIQSLRRPSTSCTSLN